MIKSVRRRIDQQLLIPAIVILVSCILVASSFEQSALAARNTSIKEGTYQLNTCESYSSGGYSITDCMNNLVIKISQLSTKYFKLKIDASQVNVCESTSSDGGTSTTTCSNNLTIELYDVTATKVKIMIKGDQVNVCDGASSSSTSTTTCTNGITITASQLTTSKFKLKTEFGQTNVCDSSSVGGTSTATTSCRNEFVVSLGTVSNSAPLANAGPDQVVVEGAAVAIDGSSSSDADKGPLPMTYYWTVTDSSGYDITLSSSTSTSPSFTAPVLDGISSATLTFQVQVNDGQAVGADTINVTVLDIDEQPPVITSSDINVSTDPGQSTAVVNSYSITTSDNSGEPVAVDCSPAEGYAFPMGTSSVSCTATDQSGNTAFTAFTVTVNDVEAPGITASDINVNADLGQSFASINSYSSLVYASDNSGSVTVSCSPAEGSQFPIGTTTVDCTATDSAGNSAQASFNVNVEDHELPSLSQGDIVQNTDQGQAYATVSFTPSASDNSGYVTVNCTPGSGSTFSIGVTIVSCTATDPSGNTASISFTVTVNDVEAPGITASDINVSTDLGQPTAVVSSYSITTSDNSGEAVAVDCSPAEGYAFPIGTSSVSCTATDPSGNTAFAMFTINVTDNSSTPEEP